MSVVRLRSRHGLRQEVLERNNDLAGMRCRTTACRSSEEFVLPDAIENLDQSSALLAHSTAHRKRLCDVVA